MLTDWILIGRLATELHAHLHGGRVAEAGFADDGRFALRVGERYVVVDAFAATPLILVEREMRIARAPGWPRSIADAVINLRVDRVRGRRGDRLIAIDFLGRSRFGVETGYRLVVELVPRFGNILLLKDRTIVSAAKTFGRERNAQRTIEIGQPYEPPPLFAPEAAPESDAALALVASGAGGAENIAGAVRALRARVPLLPRPVAESLVTQAASMPWTSAGALETALSARALDIVDAPERADALFVYREDERLIAAHVVPLRQFAHAQESRAPALLPLLAEIAQGGDGPARASFESRRENLRARLEKRRAALERERERLEAQRDDALSAERLRAYGESLYAHLSEVPSGAASFVPPSDPALEIPLDPALDAKANAAEIFKRYRKAIGKREQAEKRLATIVADYAATEDLAWEIERAEPATLEDVILQVDRVERRADAPAPKSRVKAPRARPIDVPLADDARVSIGRSPSGNDDLTFRIARPNDLWFHVREAPGAHVVLRIDAGREPAQAEVEAAAALAAWHSRQRENDRVAVDYTQRKYVRKRRGGAPGFVWYTNARTVVVAPHAPDAVKSTLA